MNEVNYCNSYQRRRRTISETESQNTLPTEVFRRGNKSRVSQSISPPPRPAAVSNDGCLSPGDTSMSEEYESRSKAGSRKIAEWLNSSQHRRHLAAEDQDVEMADPSNGDTEYRRRAGSHGLRDLLRIRPRCNSHGEKRSDADSVPVTSAHGMSGNGTPVSPGTASSSTSSNASPSVSKFRVFLDAFRHRANSESSPSPRIQLHGWCHLNALMLLLLLVIHYFIGNQTTLVH